MSLTQKKSFIRNSDVYVVSPIEALRIAAVLEHAEERLHLLSMVSSDTALSISTDSDDQQESLRRRKRAGKHEDGPISVSQILDEQRKLGQRYEELALLRKHNDHYDAKTYEAEMIQVQQKLKENTKILCRNLKETPNEINNWKKVQNERAELQTILQKCVRELQNSLIPTRGHIQSQTSSKKSQDKVGISEITYSVFSELVRKEKEYKQYFFDIVEQEKKTVAKVRQLEEEVLKEREQKEAEIEERTAKVSELMAKLRDFKKLTQESFEKTRATAEAEFESRRRNEETEIRLLEEELKKVKEELEIEKKVNAQVISFLEEKQALLKVKFQQWKTKNEHDQTHLQEQLSTAEQARGEQLNLKDVLEEKYQIECDEKKIREEQIRLKKEREKAEREKRIKDAADCIKLCFLSFKARQLYETMKAAQKKAKKPKSKSKKKKK